ncbi:MAG: hypothetical protein K2J82_07125, partial [Muribaculaceae bacterium]|nr:hypothetical protein [Muribaculaceae bacterium]
AALHFSQPSQYSQTTKLIISVNTCDSYFELPSDSEPTPTPLPLAMNFLLLKYTQDLHPLDDAHAGQIIKGRKSLGFPLFYRIT